jgi:hypothetical protein
VANLLARAEPPHSVENVDEHVYHAHRIELPVVSGVAMTDVTK